MKKFTFQLIGVLLVAVLLSGMITYFFLDGQNYRGTDGSTLTQNQAARAQIILDELPDTDYKQELKRLEEEKYSLRVYLDALDEEKSSEWIFPKAKYSQEEKEAAKSMFLYSVDQVVAQIEVLDYCIECLTYAIKNEQYAEYVQEQADKLTNISIFADAAMSNIKKTGQDFYIRDDISVIPCVTVGLSTLLNIPFGNMIAICAAVVCASIITAGLQKNSGTTKLYAGRPYMLLFLGGMIGVFLAEMIAVNMTWGIGDLSIPVQSVPEFKTCRYEITIGALLAVRLLIKCVGCFILFLLSIGLFCLKNGYYIWAGTAAILGIIEKCFLEGTVWDLRGIFHSEKMFGIYHNSYLFGTSVSSELLFGASVIFLLIFSIGFASAQMNKFILLGKEKAEKEYFEEINNRYSEIRILRHDINNHLSAVSLLLGEGKVEDAKKYLQKMSENLEGTKPPVRTGIHALDMVLWNKISQAKESRAEIQLDIAENLMGLSVSDYDLCSVFGNLLDNAVEAEKKLPEEERWIRLRVRRQMDMLCIFCENKYEIVKKENGGFATLKADYKNHGLGIRQMKHIAEKYNGTMDITTENNIFSVSILLTASTQK